MLLRDETSRGRDPEGLGSGNLVEKGRREMNTMQVMFRDIACEHWGSMSRVGAVFTGFRTWKMPHPNLDDGRCRCPQFVFENGNDRGCQISGMHISKAG